MENVRKHIIKTNYLVSEPNFHTAKFFTENLLAIEMRKTEILMNKPVYLQLSILDLSKTVMHEFYANPKYGENAKHCYVDTDSFNVHVKINDIYKDNVEDVKTRFNSFNIETDRPLPKGKNKKSN